MADSTLRTIEAPFVALGPSGVAIRTGSRACPSGTRGAAAGRRTPGFAGFHRPQGPLPGGYRSRQRPWAARKRDLTAESSSRWAGSITKATHDQWALARRAQLAHIQNLEAGVRTIAHRLSLPVGEKGTKRAPGGYRSQQEWFRKTRRLHVLEDRLERERSDREAGLVHVVRGGKRLARNRHNLEAPSSPRTSGAGAGRPNAGSSRPTVSPGSGSGTRRSASARTARSASSSRPRSRTWPTPRTAGTSSTAGSTSGTGARSGPTAYRRTGRSPTASTSTWTGAAGTSPRPGRFPRSRLFRWPWPGRTG